MPRLVKEIEKRVKIALQKPWLPSDMLFCGARDCNEFYLQGSFGSCCPLKTENLVIPKTQENNDDSKLFFSANCDVNLFCKI